MSPIVTASWIFQVLSTALGVYGVTCLILTNKTEKLIEKVEGGYIYLKVTIRGKTYYGWTRREEYLRLNRTSDKGFLELANRSVLKIIKISDIEILEVVTSNLEAILHGASKTR